MKPHCIALAVVLFTTPVLAQDSAAVVEIGKPAPEITMTGIDGRTFKLSDVAKRGKNTALMFSRANW